MSSIADDMEAQAALLESVVSCPVAVDPRDASQAPDVAVLIDPPTRNYNELSQTWTLVVLRNTADLGFDTTKALSDVVAELEATTVIHIEDAAPGARRLTLERPPVPAYLIRYITP